MSRESQFNFNNQLVKELEPQDQIEKEFMEEVNRNLKPFCTVTELSNYLKINKKTIYQLINDELLIGRRVVAKEKLVYTKSVILLYREGIE